MPDYTLLKKRLEEEAAQGAVRGPSTVELIREAITAIDRLETNYKEQKRHADAAFKEAERYRQLHLMDAKRVEEAEAKLADERKKATDAAKFAEKAHEEVLAGVKERLLSDEFLDDVTGAVISERAMGIARARREAVKPVVEAALATIQDQVRAETDSELRSLQHELCRLLGPLPKGSRKTMNVWLIYRVGQLLIERDGAQAQVLDHLDGIEWPTCPNEHDHAAAWIEGRDAAVRAFIRRLATLNPNEGESEDCSCESCSSSRLGPKGKG